MPSPRAPSIAPGQHPERSGRGRGASRVGVQTQRPEDSSAREGFHCSELHKWLSHLGGDGRRGEEEEHGHPWSSAPKATSPTQERSQMRPQTADQRPRGHQPSSFQHPYSRGIINKQRPLPPTLICLVCSAPGGLSTAVGTCPEPGRWLRTIHSSYFLTSLQSSDSSTEHQGGSTLPP